MHAVNDSQTTDHQQHANLWQYLAPDDIQVVYELEGVAYPEGLELISEAGLRRLLPHLDPRRQELLLGMLGAADLAQGAALGR
jgi:hypothetical protein